MLTLYDNPFSPFARKVRMILSYKQIEYISKDGLAKKQIPELEKLNHRGEVPVLVCDKYVIADSADIIAFIDDAYPNPPLLPTDVGLRAKARRWQRIVDTVLDAIIHDISLWSWPTHQRSDAPPQGLFETGVEDIKEVLNYFEHGFGNKQYPCGDMSLADFALFVHVSAVRSLGIPVDIQSFPKLASWYRLMKSKEIIKKDIGYIKQSLEEKFETGTSPYEDEKVVWRGDRLEWLFSKGYADWWFSELKEERVLIPNTIPSQ